MKLNIQLFASKNASMGDSRYYITLEVKETSYSTANNTSNVSYSLKATKKSGTGFYSNDAVNPVKVTINDSDKVDTKKAYNFQGSTPKTITLASGTVSGIEHTADGSKTISCSASFTDKANDLGKASVSFNLTLTKINRATTPTYSVNPVELGSPTVITHTKIDSDYRHEFNVMAGETIVYTKAPTADDSTTYIPNISIANYFPNATSGNLSVVMTTDKDVEGMYQIIGSTTTTLGITIPNSVVPSVTIGTPTEADTTMISKNWGCFVQGKSKLEIPLTPAGAYGSSIVANSTYATVEGINYNLGSGTSITTATLLNSGTQTISATTTDSRQRIGTSVSNPITIVPYSSPVLDASCEVRWDTPDAQQSKIRYDCKGSISSVNSKNAKTFKLKYKKSTETTYQEATIGTSYTIDVTNQLLDVTLDTDYSYDFKFEATDSFATTSIDRELDTGFDLMNFNSSFKAMAIGKVSEAGADESLLEIALPTQISEDVTMVDGAEIVGYQPKLTAGTNITIDANNVISASGGGGGTATDVQINGTTITSNNVANILTQSTYNASTNKIATKNDIPTLTSQLTNNSGYITNSVSNLTNYTKTSDLSSVATSGSYSDLSNKPTIPTKTSDLTNDDYVVKDSNYVHTDNNYTSTEKTKLSGIASGAEVNVQSDWNVSDSTSDAFIKNKPTIPTVNNATLTIQKNGTNVQTFTANASSNATANITTNYEVVTYNNLSAITSTSDATFLKVKKCVKNNIPFAIDFEDTISEPLVVIRTKISSSGIAFYFYNGEFMVYVGKITINGTSAAFGLSTYDLQPELISGSTIKTIGGSSILGSGNITLPTKTSDLTNDSNFITNTGSTSGNAGTATTLKTYTFNRNNNANIWAKVATCSLASTYNENHAYLFIKGTHNSNYKQNGIVAIDAVGNNIKGKIGSYAAQFMSCTPDLDVSNFYIEYLNGDDDTAGVVNFWVKINTNAWASWQIKILQNQGWTIVSSEPTASTLPSTNYTGKNSERYGYAFKSYGDKNGNDITTTYQPTLVSGTNIKTINNTSLLGSGNISITQPTKTSDLTNDSGFITSSDIQDDLEFSTILTVQDQYEIVKNSHRHSSNKDAYISSEAIMHDNSGGTYTPINDVLDDKQDKLVSGTNIKTINNVSLLGSGNISIGGGGTATDVQVNGTSITSGGVANLRTNGTYNASSNKIATMSDLPTVNNATLTIQKNGTTVNTFSANASSNVTANITVPTNTNELTNGAGFITSSYHDSSKQDKLVSGTNIKTINNTSLLSSGNMTLLTEDDIYYKTGDIIELGDTDASGLYVANGYITSSTKKVTMTFIVPKRLDNISSITVNNLNVEARGISGYLNSQSGYVEYVNKSGYTITAWVSSSNSISITIEKSSAYTNISNNTLVSIAGYIKFTLS